MGGLCVRNKEPTPAAYHSIVSQHEGRCRWLKDDKLLRELEADSVDSEILDEELRSLELREPNTCRGATLKLVESTPLQIAMCVLVLLDAGVVVAEILLDMQAIRSQADHWATSNTHAVSLLRDTFPDYLSNYNGHSAPEAIEHMRSLGIGRDNSGSKFFPDGGLMQYPCRCGNDVTYGLSTTGFDVTANGDDDRLLSALDVVATPPGALQQIDDDEDDNLVDDELVVESQAAMPSSTPRATRIRRRRKRNRSLKLMSEQTGKAADDAAVRGEEEGEEPSTIVMSAPTVEVQYDNFRSRGDDIVAVAIPPVPPPADETITDNAAAHESEPDAIELTDRAAAVNDVWNVSVASSTLTQQHGHHHEMAGDEHSEKLLKIAHILHYSSILVLGIFVLQVFVKVFAMGPEFLRKKMEIFDGAIVITSFVLDLIYVEGATGSEGVALIMVFLLWRILRIVNGLMLASKKRHEFRVRLQKRARLRLEKKLELVRDDLDWQTKESVNLRVMLREKGATDEELSTCKPRRRTIVQTTAMSGLSSIASLSLGLSMTMSIQGSNRQGGQTAAVAAMKERIDLALAGARSPRHSLSATSTSQLLHSAANRLRRASLFPTSAGSASAASSVVAVATATASMTNQSTESLPPLIAVGAPMAGKAMTSIGSAPAGCQRSLTLAAVEPSQKLVLAGGGGSVAGSRPPMRRQSALSLSSSATDLVPAAAATAPASACDGNSFTGRSMTPTTPPSVSSCPPPHPASVPAGLGLSPVVEGDSLSSAIVEMADEGQDDDVDTVVVIENRRSPLLA